MPLPGPGIARTWWIIHDSVFVRVANDQEERWAGPWRSGSRSSRQWSRTSVINAQADGKDIKKLKKEVKRLDQERQALDSEVRLLRREI